MMRRNIKNTVIKFSAGVFAVMLLAGGISEDAFATDASELTTQVTTTYSLDEDGDYIEDSKKTIISESVTIQSEINDNDRAKADADLLYYAQSLAVRYTLNRVQNDRLNQMFDSAVYYIANTKMTKTELDNYVASVEKQMETVATTDVTSTTSEYLQVADNWVTPTVSYGQKVTIVLPIINIGTEELNDIVIEPMVDGSVQKWPFEPDVTGYIQTESFIPGYVNEDNAFKNRREFTYTFTVREDVMTGYYPVDFRVSYTRAGVRTKDDEAPILTVYVQTIGKPESGVIGGNGNEDKVAKPRIIVTGYETDKDKIFSGDTFNLTIHVQNTSSTTAVTNVLFNLNANPENSSSGTSGSGSANSSEGAIPFMPTSGSNAVYVERIEPKATTDINIEMSSKAGLGQKSYALQLDMTFDAATQFDLTDKANISIPIYQESKFDLSNPEISPASISVGEQTNVMFSIYNTGKTTLYNVQVKFSADSIEDNMAFVGNLASGATGNVDVMLTGVAPTMDDGTIKADICYEDEAGNESVVNETVTVFVNSDMSEGDFDDMSGAGRRDGGELEEAPKNNTVIKIIIVIVVIALLIAAIIVVVKISKAKREASLQEEDIKDLEALEETEDKDTNP